MIRWAGMLVGIRYQPHVKMTLESEKEWLKQYGFIFAKEARGSNWSKLHTS